MGKNTISTEDINKFLHGRDEQEHIINIECSYNDREVSVISKTKNGRRVIQKEPFYPFVWATRAACLRLCNGDKGKVKQLFSERQIGIKLLTNAKADGSIHERMENGFIYLIYAQVPMSFNNFLKVFEVCENPIYRNENSTKTYVEIPYGERQYISLAPSEQYMIQSGKRLFKGYEAYDDILRMTFDIETEGLDPQRHRINQVGVRTNKGYESIITTEPSNSKDSRDKLERKTILNFFQVIKEIEPDVITGHNSENFDWEFFIVRCELLNIDIKQMIKEIFGEGVSFSKSKKKTVLKLGGEIEYFRKTNFTTYNLTDSLHAVRRAQAIDSNMQSANLKYVTKYSKLNKENRVYVPGNEIDKIWSDVHNTYALNNDTGDWYITNSETPLKEGYSEVSGRYIVERYLLDDLDETEKVEQRYNESNFLLSKILPVSYSKVCTMGTAAIWKMILLAWSYENDLAVPSFGKAGKFTGGLSRLLSVGYAPNVAKFDYNSLYPSITITWGIESEFDIMGVMLKMLEFILTERETFKDLKSKHGKEAKKLKKGLENVKDLIAEEIEKLKNAIKQEEFLSNSNDKKQLPQKVIANSFFGSYGAPDVFPWGDLSCAEKITCIGRQCLRLMVYYFEQRGYKAIVGDSFTEDTPLFIKYDLTNEIDTKTIKELINEHEIKIDEFGREYDYSEKPYKVLCRSGWVHPSYIYRHKTDKDIYRVDDGKSVVDVTSDHSLFNDKGEKISPMEIAEDTKLEYYYNHNLHLNGFDLNKIEGSKNYICMIQN